MAGFKDALMTETNKQTNITLELGREGKIIVPCARIWGRGTPVGKPGGGRLYLKHSKAELSVRPSLRGLQAALQYGAVT